MLSVSINLRLMRASWFAFSELYASFLSISSAVLIFMSVPFMGGCLLCVREYHVFMAR